jgi:hypothetical protein
MTFVFEGENEDVVATPAVEGEEAPAAPAEGEEAPAATEGEAAPATE